MEDDLSLEEDFDSFDDDFDSLDDFFEDLLLELVLIAGSLLRRDDFDFIYTKCRYTIRRVSTGAGVG